MVPSSAFHQVLRGYGVRSPLTVLPTGLPESAFVEGDGAAFRRRHDIAPGRPVILNVGRMAHEKNLPFLLEVAAAVRQRRPDLLLVMTGEGPALPSLRRRAAELGIADAVRWVGYLDRERELLDCYRAADVFVFASRTETQGLVLLEAMAQRLPVVSTAVLGTRDVLAAAQGCLTSSEHVHPFAARVLQLLDDPHLRAQVGVAGRAHARECWSAAACAKRLAALYADVVYTGAPISAGKQRRLACGRHRQPRARRQHVDRRHHEQREGGADDLTGDEHDADAVAGPAPDPVAKTAAGSRRRWPQLSSGSAAAASRQPRSPPAASNLPCSCRWLANSTMRMPFLATSPTSEAAQPVFLLYARGKHDDRQVGLTPDDASSFSAENAGRLWSECGEDASPGRRARENRGDANPDPTLVGV